MLKRRGEIINSRIRDASSITSEHCLFYIKGTHMVKDGAVWIRSDLQDRGMVVGNYTEAFQGMEDGASFLERDRKQWRGHDADGGWSYVLQTSSSLNKRISTRHSHLHINFFGLDMSYLAHSHQSCDDLMDCSKGQKRSESHLTRPQRLSPSGQGNEIIILQTFDSQRSFTSGLATWRILGSSHHFSPS
ncbi:uncharacterized protein BT62DRAFT_1078213 [Guyanagaster necrorhizus]|uniref:Uncharacterized protein n=1 Tax=Guyanagaster necrorhizus TaxID=856835 RepID=A0A9P7VNR7_9AGAR|nr:uncharacterized protein BT62DRAFT_1078213 [Guyanagaster necrorhizus MCA 3950]KAG7443715.1 hypothetical protein BT62DRAFT_1078213 [Guyanagaster necrorhizus MCA 3950]